MSASRNQLFLDPLGSNFALAPKYAKMLANGRLDGITITFHHGGIQVVGAYTHEGQQIAEPLADAISHTAAKAAEQPWAEEREYLIRKFEQRIDAECPVAMRNAASKAAFNAALATIPFEQRKAFTQSNKDYEREYVRFVNGVGERRPLDAVLQLEQEAKASRGTATRGRGRGRGGRGRGSPPQTA